MKRRQSQSVFNPCFIRGITSWFRPSFIAVSEPATSSQPQTVPRCRVLTRTLRQSGCGLLLGLALSGLAGCVSSSGDGGMRFGQSNSIQELHLLVMPVALQFTQPGSPNGFAVRVFAAGGGRAKGVPIRSGTLEILAYDGIPNDAGAPTVKPAQVVWSYPAASLAPYAVSGSLGTGYELTLPWQGQRPASSRLTLVARYTPTSGIALLSAPSIIPNTLR